MLRGGLDSALSHVMRIVYCWILFAARAHSGMIHLFFINNYTIRTYTRLYFTVYYFHFSGDANGQTSGPKYSPQGGECFGQRGLSSH